MERKEPLDRVWDGSALCFSPARGRSPSYASCHFASRSLKLLRLVIQKLLRGTPTHQTNPIVSNSLSNRTKKDFSTSYLWIIAQESDSTYSAKFKRPTKGQEIRGKHPMKSPPQEQS